MSEQVFDDALDYLERSQIEQVRLLGGEPTLHPLFIKMIEKSLQRKFKLMIFSNGLMPENVITRLKEIDPDTVTILMNTIHPLEDSPAGMARQQQTMSVLADRVVLGVNIYSREQGFDYLLDNVNKYKLERVIRLGIAHPLLSQRNSFLNAKFYPEIGVKIYNLFQTATKQDIEIGFDCGFVPCMFPEEIFDELGELMAGTGHCCTPNLDLLPDGRFISCYPLNNLEKVKLDHHTKAEDLRDGFSEMLSPYRQIGIYPHCQTCSYFKESQCNGGCIAGKICRLTGKSH